jgi:hypothetical protein
MYAKYGTVFPLQDKKRGTLQVLLDLTGDAGLQDRGYWGYADDRPGLSSVALNLHLLLVGLVELVLVPQRVTLGV